VPAVSTSLAGTAGEESRDVLDQKPSSGPNKLIGDSGEFEEEAGSISGESSALAGDGEVLAGEASEDEINCPPNATLDLSGGVCSSSACWSFPASDIAYVVEAGDIGPVALEDSPSVGVCLALGDDVDACSIGSEVEAADSAEERDGIHPCPPSTSLAFWRVASMRS
jgi:hypothetical protein